jgi:hypothetical protein
MALLSSIVERGVLGWSLALRVHVDVAGVTVRVFIVDLIVQL